MSDVGTAPEPEGGAADPPVAIFAPTLLLTVTVERSSDGQEELHIHAGGQGVWVARMLRSLGVRPVICAPVGGETGLVARHLLAEEGLEARLVEVSGWNGSYVHDRRGGTRSMEVELPPSTALSRHEVDDLYAEALATGLDAGCMVLTGTHGFGHIPADTYRRLSADFTSSGATTVADLSGEELGQALQGHVSVVKCSHSEAIEGGWADEDSLEAVAAALLKLRGAGADAVVISRAQESALALVGEQAVAVQSPPIEPVDHRGAGDSMTAGLTAALVRSGHLDEDALRLGAACGAFNVTRHGLGTGHAGAIWQLAARVEVTPLDLPAAPA